MYIHLFYNRNCYAFDSSVWIEAKTGTVTLRILLLYEAIKATKAIKPHVFAGLFYQQRRNRDVQSDELRTRYRKPAEHASSLKPASTPLYHMKSSAESKE